MAGSVFFFTSGDSPNWDRTIARPVELARLRSILPDPFYQHLQAKSAAAPIYAWGAQPSAVGTIAGMSDDDVVFGARRGLVGFGALVALSLKEPSQDLSELLWGAPTWPYVYFLYSAVFGARPVPQFLAEMGERGHLIQGFRISHKASRLLRSFGSPEDFIRTALAVQREERPGAKEPEREARDLNEVDAMGHSEAQADLIRIGNALGLSVWVATNDRSRVVRDFAFRDHTLEALPFEGHPEFQRRIELIDVLWLQGSAIRSAFEVEHSTQVYSGLLRMLDLAVQFPNLSFPLFIVAPDADRRKVCAELSRPAFERHRLKEICRYLPYSRLRDAVLEVMRFGKRLDASVIEDYAELCGPGDAR